MEWSSGVVECMQGDYLHNIRAKGVAKLQRISNRDVDKSIGHAAEEDYSTRRPVK